MVLSFSNVSKRCWQNGKQCRPRSSDSSCRRSLIWVYSDCPDLSVYMLRTISEVHVAVFYARDMSRVLRKPVYAICEQQRHRSACKSAQSDLRLCYSLLRQYHTCICYIQSFKTLASLCSWADQFRALPGQKPLRQVFWWCGSHIGSTNGQISQMSQPKWNWYLSHRRTAKAQVSLPIHTVLPEPLLFAYIL